MARGTTLAWTATFKLETRLRWVAGYTGRTLEVPKKVQVLKEKDAMWQLGALYTGTGD
jgi:hypothetical protein